jgi:alkanesulfonate monooxygenase SsuD/methylene tetrahydromethanopterin reductase-like flavin-dependent oxidoreductase (luciferase family)
MVWTPFFPGEQFQQLALAEAKKRYAITPKRVLEVLKDVTPAEAQLIPDTVIHGSTQECVEQLEPFRAIGADIAASVSPMVQQSSYFLQQLLTLRKLIK